MKLLHFLAVHLASAHVYSRLPMGIGLYSDRICSMDMETYDIFIYEVNQTLKIQFMAGYHSMEDGSFLKNTTDSIHNYIVDNSRMGRGWLQTAPMDFDFSYKNLSVCYYTNSFIPYTNIHVFSNDEKHLVTVIQRGYIQNVFLLVHYHNISEVP